LGFFIPGIITDCEIPGANGVRIFTFFYKTKNRIIFGCLSKKPAATSTIKAGAGAAMSPSADKINSSAKDYLVFMNL